MTPRKKSSLDNWADTHIHPENVRPNQTKTQAGKRKHTQDVQDPTPIKKLFTIFFAILKSEKDIFLNKMSLIVYIC